MRNKNAERIVCSSIWYKDLTLKKPEALESYGFRPINTDRGIVFSGLRHPNCMYQMVAITGLRNCEAGESIQGFLTNKNRFVNRLEGAKIALKCQQTLKPSLQFGGGVTLYSEDLW